MNEKDNTYPTPRTVEEARQVWALPSAADFHRSAPATPEAQNAAAEEKGQSTAASFYEADPLNAEPPRAAPNAEAGTDAGAPPQEKKDTPPALDARALLPHIGGINLKELADLEQRAGKGISLGLTFYHLSTDKARKFVRNTAAPVLFKGITTIAARTGGGKTLFLTSLAAHALRLQDSHGAPRFRVVFFSLEESKATISKRILSAFMYMHDLESEADEIHLSTITDYLRGETIQTEEAAAHARQNGRTPDAERIANAAAALQDRLFVLDIESLEEARAAFIKDHAELENAADISKPWQADQSTTIKALIEGYRAKYGNDVLFFVDYAQRVHNTTDERKNAATYKEIQAVMNDLISCARRGAVIFQSAQMNRDNAKETKNDPAKELWLAIPEQIREAADIEQASEMIMYLKLHTVTVQGDRYPTTFLNMRILKYRDGESEQAAAVPIRWLVRTGDFAKLREPTLPPANVNITEETTAEEEDDEPTIPAPKTTRRALPRAYKGGKK